MNINVQIQLGPNESASDLSGNATELAEKILDAVGGDADTDVVYVSINDSGSAGSVPMPMLPPTLPVPVPEESGKPDKSK